MNARSLVAGVCVALAALPGAVATATDSDLKSGLKTCASLNGGIARLLCYDQLVLKNGLKSDAKSDPRIGNWQVRTETTKIDNKIISTALISSDQEGSGEAAHMALRCREGQTDMLLQTPFHTYKKQLHVRYKIDERPVASHILYTLKSNDVLSMGSASVAIQFARSLFGARAFVLEVPRDGKIPAEFVFDISQAKKALADIAENCGWS